MSLSGIITLPASYPMSAVAAYEIQPFGITIKLLLQIMLRAFFAEVNSFHATKRAEANAGIVMDYRVAERYAATQH
ncbi:MAG TPA: hypothetical protein VND94_16360 [Terriglobia bacterium]|nr:hypothetical protein [Terriglobia bacterium]